jgi:hypothetical protein
MQQQAAFLIARGFNCIMFQNHAVWTHVNTETMGHLRPRQNEPRWKKLRREREERQAANPTSVQPTGPVDAWKTCVTSY